jgi:hypothetical protein
MSKHFRVPGRLSAKLQESGIPVSLVLQHAGLPSGLLDEPRILVTTEELFALWRGIGHLSPDPAIGLKPGTEAKPEHFDPLVLARYCCDVIADSIGGYDPGADRI